MANLDSKLSVIHVSQRRKLWDVWRGLILALTLILNLGAGIWLGLGKWGVSAAQEWGALVAGTELGFHVS